MPTLQSVISCLSDYDPTALPVDQANRIIGEVVEPVRGVEQLPIRSALDRVLAEDIVSPIDVPAHDNSAMDGYAFQGAALAAAQTATVELEVIGSAFAGGARALAPTAAQAVRKAASSASGSSRTTPMSSRSTFIRRSMPCSV